MKIINTPTFYILDRAAISKIACCGFDSRCGHSFIPKQIIMNTQVSQHQVTVLPKITPQVLHEVVSLAMAYAHKKNYILNGPTMLTEINGTFKSLKCAKKAAHMVMNIRKKITMRNFNKLMNFLCKNLDSRISFRMDYSQREKDIMEARKNWKAKHTEAEALLAEYKSIKSGFYK